MKILLERRYLEMIAHLVVLLVLPQLIIISLFPYLLTVGRLTGAILNQFDRGNNKEPERRHSSYDSSTNR